MTDALGWKVEELDPLRAQEWHVRMPRAQRLLSLSPAFAQADTWREPGLTCLHVGASVGEQRWLHTLHLRALPGGGFAGMSPYGYGGPLSMTEDEGFVRGAWNAYQVWARQRLVIGELCRPHPEVGHHRFFLGDVRFNRMTVSVDLELADLASQYNTLARRKIRRAEGLGVRWSTEAADWLAYGAFYRDAMRAMGAQARYHFPDAYFDALSGVRGARLCICSDDDEWLSAGVYLFQQAASGDAGRGGTVEYHLGASSAQGHARGTPYLMQDAAAREGRTAGLARLYLGGGITVAADDALLFYKRCFSKTERPFHVGWAVHDEAWLGDIARAKGYDANSAHPNLLFE